MPLTKSPAVSSSHFVESLFCAGVRSGANTRMNKVAARTENRLRFISLSSERAHSSAGEPFRHVESPDLNRLRRAVAQALLPVLSASGVGVWARVTLQTAHVVMS